MSAGFSVPGFAQLCYVSLRSSVIVNVNPRHTADCDKPRAKVYRFAVSVTGYSQILPSIVNFDDAYTRAWHVVHLWHEAVYADIYQVEDDADSVYAPLPPFFRQLLRQFTGDERQLGVRLFTEVEAEMLHFHAVERRQLAATVNVFHAACPATLQQPSAFVAFHCLVNV